ncbi:hypothetical protein SteCoe_33048 [Stentor coeruleus]|uniref:Uncharacterized protein n=1 Tax=Stentor coeruleus TaxID=5963 RepID=A0A1R2AXP0_9CILI|nr:hypothetical protein SteCoe_33048 [Stentor coeruleus]
MKNCMMCENQSKWLCEFTGEVFCKKHLPSYLLQDNPQNIFSIETDPPVAFNDCITQELKSRLKLIVSTKTSILETTSLCITAIRSHMKNAIQKLDSLEETYNSYLQSATNEQSYYDYVHLLNSKFLSSFTELKFPYQIEDYFSKDFVYEISKSNKTIEDLSEDSIEMVLEEQPMTRPYRENQSTEHKYIKNNENNAIIEEIKSENTGKEILNKIYSLIETDGTSIQKIKEYLEKNIGFLPEGHLSGISNISVSDNESYIISGGADKTVRVWNCKNGSQNLVLRQHKGPVHCVCLSDDGKYAISGGSDKDIIVWNLYTKEHIFTLTGHKAAVNSICISKDNKYIVSGSSDQTLRLWDFELQQLEYIFEGHTMIITSVALTQDCDFIISASNDASLRLWNVKTRSLECTISKHESPLLCFGLSKTTEKIISATKIERIRIWDIKKRCLEHIIDEFNEDASAIDVLYDDSKFVIATLSCWVQVWDRENLLVKIRFPGPNDGLLSSVKFLKDDNLIAVTNLENSIEIWSYASNKKLLSMQGHNRKLKKIDFSYDKKSCLTIDFGGTAIFWNIKEKKEVCKVNIGRYYINSIALCNNNRFFVVNHGEIVTVWKMPLKNLRD